MKKFLCFLIVPFFINANVGAQEIQAKLTVVANRVSTQVDKKIFNALQNTLTNFINNRKWTKDNYQPHERIRCNFLINIDEDLGNNVFKASLTVQAARPIYNSQYESPLINFQDNDLAFRYVEFQPIEFNENRVQGNDPLVANLPAVIAYYVNIILGMDYASFMPRGGDAYFLKAQNIVNNAPESGEIFGWKAFQGTRNRFRLAENFTDNRFSLIHDAIYTYYRNGMDLFSENEKVARNGIINSLNYLSTINTENPNSMALQFFFQGKSTELVKTFSKADSDLKLRAFNLLSKLDITNAAVYKELK